MQRHGQADGFVGVVMDCGMTGVSDLRCFGLATCVMETIEGHEGGGKSAWGLVLRGIQDSGLEDPVYKRVGWFSSFYWEAAQELSEVTIV
jgi:hypothetical protein